MTTSLREQAIAAWDEELESQRRIAEERRQAARAKDCAEFRRLMDFHLGVRVVLQDVTEIGDDGLWFELEKRPMTTDALVIRVVRPDGSRSLQRVYADAERHRTLVKIGDLIADVATALETTQEEVF